MQNIVGDTIPTEREVESLLEEIKSLTAKVTRYTTVLTSEQRLKTTKMRAGGEVIVATVGHLATEHGVTLPGISVEAMRRDLLLAQRLAPLATAVDGLASRLSDTLLEAQSECWWATTAFYTAMSRMVDIAPALGQALRPVVEFFAVGPRAKPAPAQPAT
jgi:hypothetical protein